MERQKIIIKTSIKAIIVNALLVTFKLIIGLISNSIAIVLDAINNLTDSLSSIITIIGIKLSSKAPDKEHPYGHGRIEYFTSIIIGMIILIAGFLSLKESFKALIKPITPNHTMYTIIVVVAAIIAKLLLGTYVKKIGKKINSGTLIASGTDALFDAVISIGTLISAILYMTLKINIEAIIGLLISLFILKVSIDILKETLNELIGTRINKELSTKITETINDYKEVKGTYDLLVHNYGPTRLIGSVKIEVDDKMTAKEIHALSKDIENTIYKNFGIHLTIGIFASNNTDKESKEIKEELNNIITNYKDIKEIHGFNVDIDNKIIHFDIIVDYTCEGSNKIRKSLIKKLKQFYPNYTYNIVIDKESSE